MDRFADDMAVWIAETFYKMECDSGQKINEIYQIDKLERSN